MKRTVIIIATVALALLQGCSLGPDYHAPELPDTGGWSASEGFKQKIAVSPVAVEWWQELKDPLLTSYIREASRGNLDVKIAETVIREARAARRAEKAGYYPQVGSQASITSERLSENGRQLGMLPNLYGKSIDNTINVYDLGFDAGWELDIFGGTERAVQAAEARIDASVEARRHILLSIFAEIARNYVELRGNQRQQIILKKNIDLQNKTLNIVRERYKAGVTNELELSLAERQLRITEALLPNLISQLRSNAYQIAVLLGKQPQAILQDFEETKPLPMPPDIVPVGLPSDILRRRPDIREAERNLAAATADIGVAEAELFPSFSLTGTAGLESLTFGDLFQSGSTMFALGPMIRWPVFQGGRIRAQIKAREAKAERAALIYEQTVLNALKETETALSRYGQELETVRRLRQAVTVNERTVVLAKQRYEDGADDILSVVYAERELANTEHDLVIAETRAITYLISLYKALGGGWESFDKVLK